MRGSEIKKKHVIAYRRMLKPYIEDFPDIPKNSSSIVKTEMFPSEFLVHGVILLIFCPSASHMTGVSALLEFK